MTPFVIAICALFTISVLFYVFYLREAQTWSREEPRELFART